MAACHNCGKIIENDAKFCSACGSAVEISANAVNSLNEKKFSIKQIAVGALVFLAFIVLIYNSGTASLISVIVSFFVTLVSLIVLLVRTVQKKDKKKYRKICIISLVIFIISIVTPTSVPITLDSPSSTNNDSQLSGTDNTDNNEIMEPKMQLSEEETIEKLNEFFDDTTNLITGHSEAIAYWTDNDFETIEDIQNYEAMWKKLADDAKILENSFLKYLPDEQYTDLWENFQSNISGIYVLFSTCENLDANGDGTYTGGEISTLIKSCGTELVDRYQTIVSIIDAGAVVDEKGAKPQNTEICNIADCNKEATYALRGINSSKIIYSCEEHLPLHIQIMEATGGSWEFLDINPCIECGEVATQIIKSPFSGEKEFYCTKHYDEINNMIDDMQNNESISSNTEINSARHNDSEAWTCAKSIVKSNLKNPSSAKFCTFNSAIITHLGNGEYKVEGWVEGTNSFGATIREYFTVTYTATPSGYKNGSVNFS